MSQPSTASILIVEDDRHLAAYLDLHLRHSGYRIAGIAHNGPDALDLAETTQPDAIIMDILLPGPFDGIDAANRIRARREVPILFLTAHADPTLFERAKTTDPAAYLLKPFNERELVLAIELAIQRHGLRIRREQSWLTRVGSLLETMTDGLVVLDRDWRYVYVNRRAGEMFNRAPELLLGKVIWEEFPEGVGQPFYHACQRVMAERVATQSEDHYEPWDRWFESRIFPSDDGISIYFQEITERKRTERQIALVNQRLQALSARLLRVQEEERRTLARELHDEIGQSLTALKITLQSLGLRPETAALQPQIEAAVGIADVALTQARQMSLNLRPPQLDDLGLSAAIRWNLTRQAAVGGLNAHFSAHEVPDALPEEIAIAGYRISQEALTNVLRHAHARDVWVRLRYAAGALHLEVQDDGAGFDPARAFAGAASMGMLSMQERAQLAGGKLEIESTPGRGSLVRAVFPLDTGLCT
ncbi:response regulator [Rhodoferax sp.]|uniref:response regulator n=1 Tax=Rhodoferax sp. TaxID=50421 RepID=UPI00276F9450|nr:response regulator [Rhodoferax sp.]